jgi:hypothetical protein
MAFPVINNVVVTYPGDKGYKLPGEAAELFIYAVDSDTLTISVTIKVTDSSGNVSPDQTVEIVQSDVLTYNVTSTNATVTQDPTQPNHFFVV